MQKYQIVQVDFPFLDKNIVKTRPCLLLSKPKGKHKLVVIAYMTSSDLEIEDTDVILEVSSKYFEKTGLNTKTVIKLHRLEHLSIWDIQGVVGEIDVEKSLEIKEKLKLLLDLG
jgi:mRNA-degrading endonuclease toxin of MazEF toxin-antitoxin module